jgi:hypothetical protein
MDYIVRSVKYTCICFPVLYGSPHVKYRIIQLCIRTTAVSMSINSFRETAPMPPFPQQKPNYLNLVGGFFGNSDASVNFRSAEVESKRTPPEYTRYTPSFIYLFVYLLFHLSFDGFLSYLNITMG